MIIRPERKTDEAAIRRVNEAAFDQPAEADLVDALRSAGADVVGGATALYTPGWAGRGDPSGHADPAGVSVA